MKAGDLVRFRHPHYIHSLDGVLTNSTAPEWKIGILIEYHQWEKIATILSDDTVFRIAARDVQKFGRRYLSESR